MADDSEALYLRMRRYLRDRNLEFDVRRSELELSDTLGSGQFGYVCRATYRIDGEPPVTVAVKMLKTERLRLIRHPSRQVSYRTQ